MLLGWTFILICTGASGQRRVNGDIVFLVAPEYKQAWREAQRTGTVSVAAIVDEDGSAHEIRVLSPTSAFDGEVTAAVQTWLFNPPMCVTNDHKQYDALFDVAFERDGDRFFVAVRNARYTVPGEPGGPPAPRKTPPRRVAGEDP